jgi:hypothetical protein
LPTIFDCAVSSRWRVVQRRDLQQFLTCARLIHESGTSQPVSEKRNHAITCSSDERVSWQHMLLRWIGQRGSAQKSVDNDTTHPFLPIETTNRTIITFPAMTIQKLCNSHRECISFFQIDERLPMQRGSKSSTLIHQVN